MEQPRLDTNRSGLVKKSDEEIGNSVDATRDVRRRSGAARVVVEQELIRDPHGW